MRDAIRILLLGGAWAACVSTPSADPASGPARAAEAERDVAAAFGDGLAAARRGDLAAATAALTRVAEECAGTATGDRATLSLLGVLLDPRNPEREVARARRLAAAYLASGAVPSWAEPLTEALYLAALDLGDAPEAAAGAAVTPAGRPPPLAATAGGPGAGSEAGGRPAPECDVAAPRLVDQGPRLPALPGRPMSHTLALAEAERASLADTVARLEDRIEELEREIERIRRALQP